MSHKIDLFTALIWTTLAGTGGAVRYVASRIKNKEKIDYKTFCLLLLANSFMSGFSGLILSLISTLIMEDHTYHLIAAGVGGYLGVEVLNLLSLIVKTKLLKLTEKESP